MCVCDGADTKSSIVGRRVHIPGQKRHKFGQSNSSTEGSACDNLIAETRCFVFHSPFSGESVQLFKKRFGVFCFVIFF